jgi:probable O-glycosylation ligase (exosortase A-associated)
MRDILITLLVVGSLPLTLKRPWIGVLMWVWISVMNPHRLAYGFAYSAPFAAVIAATTLVGLLITKDPKKLPMTPVIGVLITFTIWMNITTLFSLWPADSFVMLQRVMKTMLMTLVMAMVIKNRKQIDYLIWALVMSIGYYGVKGGVFTILTGGSFRVWGPEGSYIEGNNEVALAIIAIIPMMYYLMLVSSNKWVRRAMMVSMLCCTFAALGSYSRGALLGISAMLLFLWLKSPKKLVPAIVMALVVPLAIAFMPAQWTDRMNTIETYQSDASAMGRINAWWMAFHLASERPLGGGFEIYNRESFARWAPDPDDVHAAHSVYFQAMGEHGFVGLALYLLLIILTWRQGSRIIRSTARLPDYQWARHLATMIQVSMIGFGTGGAFLSLLYYDVPYYLMATMVVTGTLVEKAVAEQAAKAKQGRAVANGGQRRHGPADSPLIAKPTK